MKFARNVLTQTLAWMTGTGAALLLSVTPALADAVRSVDPNAALASDAGPSDMTIAPEPSDPSMADVNSVTDPVGPQDVATTLPSAPAVAGGTYRRDDVIGAAEGVFGKGAKGLAEIVEKILKDQGEPNAYIAGREASGAIVVGLRYGSGTMTHTVEGQRPVYWTGPSIGFDLGGDATKTFVLVYNLFDSQDLYRRYPQVEGRAYFVGGFSATYLRRGNVALIPIRLGVGVRLGANIGYMKFSEKSKWLPF
jgi:hypothetical protein